MRISIGQKLELRNLCRVYPIIKFRAGRIIIATAATKTQTKSANMRLHIMIKVTPLVSFSKTLSLSMVILPQKSDR
jgi:hypothetical protein